MSNYIPVYIQAVPERLEYVKDYILPKTKSSNILDNEMVSIDREKNGAWANMKYIYQDALEREHDLIIVLQDDIILHKQIDRHIEDIVSHLSTNCPIISLFTPPRTFMTEAYEDGANFVRTQGLWGQATVCLRSWIEGVLNYTPTAEEWKRAKDQDDVRWMYYAQRNDLDNLVCLPSLVRHNLTMKSIMGNAPVIGGHLKRDTPLWEHDISTGHFKYATIQNEPAYT